MFFLITTSGYGNYEGLEAPGVRKQFILLHKLFSFFLDLKRIPGSDAMMKSQECRG